MMTRSLPPLNALRAFEAAGRHLSFTKAAVELNVTPAAIGHQVKALEELLDIRLFRRLTRALRLTDAGQAALPTLTEGFDTLARGVAQMGAHSERGLLSVSVSPSFGALWLVPRLERFCRRHPDIEIRIDGTDRRVDVARGDADVALRYGPGGYRGVRVDWLFGQVNTPVCSPALLSAAQPLRRPDDLRHHTLLHIDWKDAEASWRMWLRAAGLHDIDPTRGPHFTMESMGPAGRARRPGRRPDRRHPGGRRARRRPPGAPLRPGPQHAAHLLLLLAERKRRRRAAQGRGLPRLATGGSPRLRSGGRREAVRSCGDGLIGRGGFSA